MNQMRISKGKSWEGSKKKNKDKRDMFSPNKEPNHEILQSLTKSPKDILVLEKDYNEEEQNSKKVASIMPHGGDDDESLGFSKSKMIVDKEDSYKRRRLNQGCGIKTRGTKDFYKRNISWDEGSDWDMTPGTDKTKITRKPSKNGQTRTRERKSVQEPEAKVKKSTLVNSQS
ncbi:hypothetical protein Tco_1352409 [Tanacetum coccineum]